jgi:SnoaL-like domain
VTEPSIERLWAVHEIRQLVYRYAFSFDSRDVPALESLWLETDDPLPYPHIDIHTVRAASTSGSTASGRPCSRSPTT